MEVSKTHTVSRDKKNCNPIFKSENDFFWPQSHDHTVHWCQTKKNMWAKILPAISTLVTFIERKKNTRLIIFCNHLVDIKNVSICLIHWLILIFLIPSVTLIYLFWEEEKKIDTKSLSVPSSDKFIFLLCLNYIFGFVIRPALKNEVGSSNKKKTDYRKKACFSLKIHKRTSSNFTFTPDNPGHMIRLRGIKKRVSEQKGKLSEHEKNYKSTRKRKWAS